MSVCARTQKYHSASPVERLLAALPREWNTPRPRTGRPFSKASRRWASRSQSDRWSGRPPGAPPSSLASSFTGGASPRRPAGAVAPRVRAASLRWRLGAPCVPLARGSVVPCSPSLAAARLRARGPGYARPEPRTQTPNHPSPEPPARFRSTAKSACARIFRPCFAPVRSAQPHALPCRSLRLRAFTVHRHPPASVHQSLP